MPRPEDLKRFQNDIRKLGRETELLASWGEQPFDVPRPQGSPESPIEDLGELLDLSGTDADRADAETPLAGIDIAAADDAPADLDFSSFLDKLSLEPAPADSTAPSEGQDDSSIPTDLLAGLGDELAATEKGSDEVPFESQAGEPGSEEPPPFDAEGFGLPSFDEGFDLPAGEEPGATGADEPPARAFDEADAPDSDQTSGIRSEDFSLPDFEATDADSGGVDADSGGFDTDYPTPEPSVGTDGAEADAGLGAAAPEAFDSGFSIPEFEESAASPSPETEPAPPAGPDAEPEGFEIGFEEAPPPRQATADEDDFDAFTSKLGIEPGASETDGLGGFDLDTATAEIEPAGEFQEPGGDLTPSDTFNLESGWGQDFRIPGFEEPKQETKPKAAPAAVRSAAGTVSKAQAPREVSLSEAQVDRLQDTLLAYPLNLRVAIEDALANDRGTEAQRSELVWALVEGAPPKKAADLAGAALHKRIEVPKAFEKRTGAAFEAEKGSLAWILVNRVMPVILGVAAALVVAGGLAWLGWKFVYTPIAASAAYRSGYESIRADRYVDAERSFARGDALWRMKKWYYLYAEAYVERQQYAKAELKYEALLNAWPGEKRAALDYAELERGVLLNYEKAAQILELNVLNRNRVDADALLMLGDVYLEWGDETRGDWTTIASPPLPRPEQAVKGSASWLYEQARLRYARLLGRRGWKDPYLERMLRYFIRAEKADGRDMLPEIERLGRDFLDGRMKISAIALAELGGYLLDRDDLDGARRALLLADKLDPALPDTHYHMARYFSRSGDSGQEFLALRKLVPALENLPLLRTYRLGMLIDAFGWMGLRYQAEGEFVTAREQYERAITRYEEALAGRRLGLDGRYGVNYARLADLLYQQAGDDAGSISLYERAEQAGYVTNETRYRRAAALYRLARFEEALVQAHRASLDVDETPALLLLTGNILARREDWFAAQSTFERLSTRLRFELDRLPVLLPQERPAQGELVELLMRATNNLGVAWWRLAARAGDASLRGKAMAAFAESMRLFDALERDQATMVKPAVKNLAFLNMDFVLRPQRGIDLEIYPEAPRELGR